MKVFFTCLVTVVFALFTTNALAFDDQGFEDWETDTDLVSYEEEYGAYVYQESSTVYEGSYSVGLEARWDDNKGVFQVMDVEGGSFYVFCGFLYPVVNTEEEDMGLVISWFDENGVYTNYYSGPAYSTGINEWELVCLYGPGAPENAAFGHAKVRCYADAQFCGYVDWVEWYPVSCTDADGDRYSPDGGECGEEDCDDTDPEVHPGVLEGEEQGNCDDGIDNDCDGLADTDPECPSCFVSSVR